MQEFCKCCRISQIDEMETLIAGSYDRFLFGYECSTSGRDTVSPLPKRFCAQTRLLWLMKVIFLSSFLSFYEIQVLNLKINQAWLPGKKERKKEWMNERKKERKKERRTYSDRGLFLLFLLVSSLYQRISGSFKWSCPPYCYHYCLHNSHCIACRGTLSSADVTKKLFLCMRSFCWDTICRNVPNMVGKGTAAVELSSIVLVYLAIVTSVVICFDGFIVLIWMLQMDYNCEFFSFEFFHSYEAVTQYFAQPKWSFPVSLPEIYSSTTFPKAKAFTV